VIEILDRFFDPLAVTIVIGGTLIACFFSATGRGALRALGALGPLVSARPAKDGRIADRAVRQIQQLSEYKGLFCVDRVQSPGEFVHRAACRLADEADAEAFAVWAREELEDRRARHQAAIGFWRQASEIAPAMGMIGTVGGLVTMFARMNDPAMMGPAMAIAMLTTLYGLILSFVVAGPIAARLERLSDAECAWQARAVERLVALARAEEDARPSWPPARLKRAG
jgi:chemotaxis protein MotA